MYTYLCCLILLIILLCKSKDRYECGNNEMSDAQFLIPNKDIRCLMH